MKVSTFAYCKVLMFVYRAPKNATATRKYGLAYVHFISSASNMFDMDKQRITTAEENSCVTRINDGAGIRVTTSLFKISIEDEHVAYAAVARNIQRFLDPRAELSTESAFISSKKCEPVLSRAKVSGDVRAAERTCLKEGNLLLLYDCLNYISGLDS